MDQSWKRRAVAVAGVACMVAAGAAAPAQAGKDRVVRGELTRLTATAGDHAKDLRGRAQLVRTGSGKSILTVHVSGLAAGETYGVHLHNLPCAAPDLGGTHYKHDPAGVGKPPNELWASSSPKDPLAGVTANRAGHARGKGTARWIASDKGQSVVIHRSKGHAAGTAGGPKLACADLS